MYLYMIKHIFAPLQHEKITLQPFSLLGTCASTLYIGKRLKAYYLPFAAVFVFYMYVSTNFRFWYVFSRLFLFPFSLAFLFHENCA